MQYTTVCCVRAAEERQINGWVHAVSELEHRVLEEGSLGWWIMSSFSSCGWLHVIVEHIVPGCIMGEKK